MNSSYQLHNKHLSYTFYRRSSIAVTKVGLCLATVSRCCLLTTPTRMELLFTSHNLTSGILLSFSTVDGVSQHTANVLSFSAFRG